MNVVQRYWNQVFAIVVINKGRQAYLSVTSEVSQRQVTDVLADLIKPPRHSVPHQMSHGDFNFLLGVVNLLQIRKSLRHVDVFRKVCGRIARFYQNSIKRISLPFQVDAVRVLRLLLSLLCQQPL